VGADLQEELRVHRAEPFPTSVVKGDDYGEVDAVMIDADIFGWSMQAESLSHEAKSSLAKARDELQQSIPEFPDAAKPYYERLVRIATLALEY
jgi:hypothetical protein